ncbi:hypothetical protein [Moraxella catarrhalis]|uniref:hypothetical protein n=1 Tax=Moraxella catarrhalis TaxID=480 RepID=UPI0007E3EEBB|nr:hypothetical protein [Moraxella catarrhalis]MPW55982.1 hypothetical protein [Moraxella catarrhalis]MPX02208.1 hypothetical protein [Moraxella catarrhalis]MPX41837.1 hypothetical protein [Moraxella catarrhalis]OBX40904.1 hypothetical protein A9Z59_08855 [Moraxella catarrhalis]RKL94241.1 hypothetical protein D6E02_04140 [Moraxella catarrhalis]
MFELSIEQIKMVSGGGSDSSGNNYGDSGSNKTNSNFSWGQGIGGAVGTIAGAYTGPAAPWASPALGLAGSYVGHKIVNIDYHQLGENYKNSVDRQLQNGLFHND